MFGQKKIFLGARILGIGAFLLVLAAIAGGPGVHLGLWSPLEGFILSMRIGFLGGLILSGLSLLVLIFIMVSKNYSGAGKVILTFCVGLLLASPVGYLRLTGGGGVPPIHDITTNFVNPPEFITLVGNRGEGANSLEYDMAKLVPIQKESYPDITPILTAHTPEQAFTEALSVAQELGWDVTGIDAEKYRFEATDHTFWFAFADDVVVVISAVDQGSQIDLRSVSRVGMSDLGANANRIRRFQNSYQPQD